MADLELRSEFASYEPVFDRSGKKIGERVYVSRGYRRDGSRNKKSKTVHGSHAKAMKVARDIYEDLGDPSQSRDKDVTLRVFAEDVWLPFEKDSEEIRDETYRDYDSKVRLHILPTLGHRKIKSIEAKDVQDLMNALRKKKTPRQPEEGERYLSPTTIRSVYRRFHTMMRDALLWGYVTHSPFEALKSPSAPRRPDPKTLTAADAKRYFAAFRGHVLEPAVLLSLGAGLRRSESLGCDWEDIRFDSGTYALRHGLQQRDARVYYEDLKTQESRAETPLAKWVAARLYEIRGSGPVVPDGDGPMSPQRVVRLFDRRIKEAELPRVTMMALRHSFANILKAEGVNVYVIQMLMRHTTIVTTQTSYFDRDIAPLFAGTDALDSLLQDRDISGTSTDAGHLRDTVDGVDSRLKKVVRGTKKVGKRLKTV